MNLACAGVPATLTSTCTPSRMSRVGATWRIKSRETRTLGALTKNSSMVAGASLSAPGVMFTPSARSRSPSSPASEIFDAVTRNASGPNVTSSASSAACWGRTHVFASRSAAATPNLTRITPCLSSEKVVWLTSTPEMTAAPGTGPGVAASQARISAVSFVVRSLSAAALSSSRSSTSASIPAWASGERAESSRSST